MDLVIRIDPDDFGEVVGNLLDNARKWARTRVVVRSVREGPTATVSVLDDGPGFVDGAPDPESDRGLSAGSGQGSTGLGLGIVHDILSEYGVGLRVGEEDGLCSVSFALAIDATAEPPVASVATSEPNTAVGAIPKIA